jgi:RNase H-like domain found in reverse transcriptase
VAKAAAVVKPLTDALKGGKKGATTLDLMADMSAAFQLAKQALADACPLDHPSATAELSLATDASSTHVGGVL